LTVVLAQQPSQRFRGGLVFKAYRLGGWQTKWAHYVPLTVVLALQQACGTGALSYINFPVKVLFFFFLTLVTGPIRSLSLKLSDTRRVKVLSRKALGMSQSIWAHEVVSPGSTSFEK